jgi:hypothetical protein
METLLREREIAAAEAAEAEADAEWQAAQEARRARVAASRQGPSGPLSGEHRTAENEESNDG